jgi:serine/threonine protein kinase
MLPIEPDPETTVIEALDPRLGQVIGARYHLVHKLAAGGFGAVYIAIDLTNEAEVAVKLVHARHAQDPLIVARFARETEAISSLGDPHTVAALDAGEAEDGTPYLVMELLAGENLYEHFKAHGVLTWQRVVHIARGVCSSLAEAHALGIIHRDLKPANIHLEHRGGDRDYVKVLDFGIAKVVESSVLDNAALTYVGQMVGTGDYMAPEQLTGMATPRSDLFTLGVVMYEMLVGARPFGDGKGPAALLAAVIAGPPPAIPHVPPTLSQIILRCIDPEPQRRYRDARELSAALAHLDDDAPTLTMPLRMPLAFVNPRSLNSTIRGIVALRPSRELAIDAHPRLAAGTKPISNDPRPNAFSETTTTATGLSNYSSTSWRAVAVALVLAMVVIAIGLVL